MSKDAQGYWLAIDQGTTSTRAVVYDSFGQTVATAQRKIALHRPAPGQVEQDAREIETSVEDTVSEVVRSLDSSQRIRGAGLATQRSSVVAWDRITGEPLSRALSWQDTRCADKIRELNSHAKEVRRRTGLPLSPHYGATKIEWLLREEHADHESIREAERDQRLAIGPLASFVVQHLLDHQSGQRAAVVDHANAGRTQLMDVVSGKWDPWLMELFGVPNHVLPDILPTECHFGTMRLVPAPLQVVQGDQTAAVFGQGGLDDDMVHVNLGTGGFVLAATANVDFDTALLRSVASSRQESGGGSMDYVLEGTINGCGAAVDWAAKQLGLEVSPENIERWLLATHAPIFVNTVGGGVGSPYWRSGTEAHWVDKNNAEFVPRDTDAAMLGVLESIFFLVVANLRAMTDGEDDRVFRTLRATGGLSKSDAFCQGLADATQLEVQRPATAEATSRGVAWLAAGRPASWNDAANRSQKRWTPQQHPERMQRCEELLTRLEAL